MNNVQDYLSAVNLLTPELWMVGAIILASLWNLFFPKAKQYTPLWCLLGLAGAIFHLLPQFELSPTRLFGGLYTLDKLTVGFGILACLVGFIVVLMSMGDEHQMGPNRGEYYAILLTAVLSVMLLAGSTDLIMLFVALETLSICCVLLSGLFKRDRKSNEAALKYLLSTAATTATLLYGLSFVYGLTGSTNYTVIHEKMMALTAVPSLLVIFVLVLLMSAVGFKLSAVPFHMWTPDVYEGAPTPVTAFLSIGSKAGGFVVAIRLLTYAMASAAVDWTVVLGVLAILSMVAGNLIALAQRSFKRMLAYSSIAHVGYILIGLVANSQAGLSATMFYLIVYGLMNLGAFAGAIMFSNETGSDSIDDYAGLFQKRPWLALGMSVCLLNLAGLPVPPAGFFAKAFVFWSGMEMARTESLLGWTLVAVALLTSVPAIYYYTRVVIKMIVREPSEKVQAMGEGPAKPLVQFGPSCALILCVLGICLSSVVVTPFMTAAGDTVSPIVKTPAISALPGRYN
jgi:NAD(P)H-quinone oxidoreductase subunit 2